MTDYARMYRFGSRRGSDEASFENYQSYLGIDPHRR